jgi:hypothetical protein
MMDVKISVEDSPHLLDEHGPLFILGCPRSGTSFLTECVRKLHDVAVFVGVLAPPRIMHLIARNSEQGTSVDELMACVRDIFWHAFWTRRYFRSERIAELYQRNISLLEFLRKPSLADAVFCYKEPFLCFAADSFAREFPRSKFIHIVRDGRDNADSLMRHYPGVLSDAVLRDKHLVACKNSEIGSYRAFDSSYIPWWVPRGEEPNFLSLSEYGRCVWMWRVMTERACRIGSQVGSARYLEVKYEDFVAQPLPWGEKVAAFLGKTLNRRTIRALKKSFTTSVQISKREENASVRKEAADVAGRLLAALGYGDVHAAPTPQQAPQHLAQAELRSSANGTAQACGAAGREPALKNANW